MKTGRLSLIEKAAIQGLLGQEKSVEEIADTLDRSETAVNKYIDGELDELHSNIAKAKMKKPAGYSRAGDADIEKTTKIDDVNINSIASEELVLKVFKRLVQSGLKENDANKVIDIALKRFAESGKRFKDGEEGEEKLYTESIKSMKAGDFMIKKSVGGEGGVAVMTSAASQRTDKPQVGYSRSAKDSVFRPNN